MLLTARANHGALDERGVVGHATSLDLVNWAVEAPLSRAGCGFGQLEDLQVEVVDERPVLFFSCHGADMARRMSSSGGTFAVGGASVLGEWPVGEAQQLSDDSLYCGRGIRDRSGQWVMLAFHNVGGEGFVGEISDPMPLTFSAEGKLKLLPRPGWAPASSGGRTG
jgi:beta-fructofuranosidase